MLRVNQDQMVLQGPVGPQDLLVLTATQDNRVLKVIKEQLDKQAREDHRVSQGTTDQQVRLVPLVLRARPVVQDLKVLVVPRVIKVLGVMPDLRDNQEAVEHQDLLDQLDHLVLLVL